MDALVFVFLGAIALVLMVLSTNQGLDTETRLIFAIGSMVSWGVWAIQAGNVTSEAVPSGESYIGLMVLGVLFGLVMLVVVYRHGLELLSG